MCDGNGRLARLLMLMYMNEHGYHKVLNLTVSKSITENISGYYNSFIEAEKQITLGAMVVLDVTPFLVYMLQVFRRSLLTYNVYNTTTLSEKELTVVTKMKKNGIHAEITIVKCAKILKMSEVVAEDTLDTLVEKGILERVKADKAYVYRLL